MFVIRIGKDGSFKNSRPCKHCIMTLKKFRIQKVIYSNELGGFTEENVDEMKEEDAFVTIGWKRIEKLIVWNKMYS